MIDMHTHILPYVDDGSENMSISIDLIKQELKAGVTDIFVTPHYMKIRNYLSDYQNNLDIFNRLKAEVKNQGLAINLHLGNEIYVNELLLKNLKNKITVPMGNSNYVLIEFSLIEEEYDMGDAINNLLSVGYIPIIAHPERYPYLRTIKDYKIIKKMGALIQINAESIMGAYGKKVKKLVYTLLKENLVDFVASDVHGFRKNYLLESYILLKKKFDENMIEKIYNNQVIIKN